MPATPDITTVLSLMKPKKKTVRICLDGELLDKLDRLHAQMQEAKVEDSGLNRMPLAPQLARAYEELRKQAVAAEVEFVFVAIGRRAWSDLMLAHPPTDEQKQQAKDGGFDLQFDPEAFPMAAIAASCVEPAGMTVEAVERLYERLNDGQWLRLWTEGCLGANVTGTDVPFSAAAYAALDGSGTSSAPPANTESPEASS